MKLKKELLGRKWKRWTALVMVVVMILLQPCTALADAGVGRKTVEIECENDGRQKNQMNGKSEDLVVHRHEKVDFTVGGEFETEPNRDTEVASGDGEEKKITGTSDAKIEEEPETSLHIETEALSEEATEAPPFIETEDHTELETEKASEESKDQSNLKKEEISEKETELLFQTTAENTYEVRFLADNVVVETQTVESGGCAREPDIPVKPGYTFVGWSGDYTKVLSNRIIYAVYVAGEYTSHKVTFLDHDGRLIVNQQYILDGGDASRPAVPVREGHTFTGWDGNWFNVKADMEIKAKYREGEHKTYILVYYGYNINSTVKRILKEEWVVEGEDGTPPDLEDREGYTFAGWTSGKNYVNVKAGGSIQAVYYTGKYRTHKVEFVDYNGKVLMNPQYIVDGGSPVSPLKPVREGYTFLGWDKEFYRITAPVKIQALYREGNYTTHPVTFYGKITGNTYWQLLKTEYVPMGEDAHPPKVPINTGYTFQDWSGKITGIQTSQNLYAIYNSNTETETTYTVRFWCRGEVIKTEEVAAGGNATPPVVSGVKGYSFAGWDKSYVNINPGTRSMAVDITAQYQLTSGIQNAGSVTDLVNALMALGVPVAVKNGFSALGAAIINPFDGIILDVLAATALVGTIIYYWDDIKGLWEDIKTVFRNFAGMDAAGEILGNIEAGVDEAGKGDAETDAIAEELGAIAGQYGIFECKEAADAMAEYLKKQKQEFKFITMHYPVGNGIIISLSKEAIYGFDSKESRISENGYHYGIEYKGIVHCNVHPLGLPRAVWEADFLGTGQEFRTVTPP